MNILSVLALASALLFSACDSPKNSGEIPRKFLTREASRNIRVVFFDFNGQHVKLSLDDQEIFDGPMSIRHPETGLSLVVPVMVDESVALSLSIDDVSYEAVVFVGPNSKILYVSPYLENYIDLSENDAILLD